MAFLKEQAERCLIFCTKKNFFCTNFLKTSRRFFPKYADVFQYRLGISQQRPYLLITSLNIFIQLYPLIVEKYVILPAQYI